MRARRSVVLAGTILALLAPAGPAAAEPSTDYEMPFRCGQPWTGTTRSHHSPSVFSIDWNRINDQGQRALASGAGVVDRVVDLGGRSYGRYVVVDHLDGESTLYAHLDASYVTVGQTLDQGEVLGLVGGSGGVTGPHLHYEQREGSQHVRAWFHGTPYTMGTTLRSRNCPDTPIAGDWDGDGEDEVGVMRRRRKGKFRLQTGEGTRRYTYAQGTDTPLVGSWDGDKADEVGAHRARRTLFLLRRDDGSSARVSFGETGDRGVSGDWDGNGTAEVGVWRPSTARFHLQPTDGGVRAKQLGTTGSLPVTGDWDGDGRTDLGAFDAGRWDLWLRRKDGSTWSATVSLGAAQDLPVTGDWNGDGATELGVWSPDRGRFTLRRAKPLATGAGQLSTVDYGAPR